MGRRGLTSRLSPPIIQAFVDIFQWKQGNQTPSLTSTTFPFQKHSQSPPTSHLSPPTTPTTHPHPNPNPNPNPSTTTAQPPALLRPPLLLPIRLPIPKRPPARALVRPRPPAHPPPALPREHEHPQPKHRQPARPQTPKQVGQLPARRVVPRVGVGRAGRVVERGDEHRG